MMRALRAGDADGAIRAATRITTMDSDDADGHFIEGLCRYQQGEPDAALQPLRRATMLAPGRADYQAQLALCCSRLQRPVEALAVVERAAALPTANGETRNMLGTVLAKFGRHAEALTQFEAAANLVPDNLEYQYDLAQACLFTGEFDRARAVAERVVASDPGHWNAHLLLAGLLDGPPPEGRIAALEDVLQRVAGNVDGEVLFGHALARSLEAAGDTARAFEVWEKTKSAKKAAIGYSIESDRSLFAALEQAFDAGAVADARPGDPSSAPIFVVGMPRSGTTLVERILSSHSSVAAAGELTYLPSSVSSVWGGGNAAVSDASAMAAALAADPAAIGASYLRLAEAQVGDVPHYVDKQPLNFFFIGFIRRALPNAKIVCMRRGALDTCMANFRQHFTLNYPQYRYALSLLDIAEYFVLFGKLMAHWDRLFPGAIHYVQYEQLVADPEGEIRQLVDHVGLDFEPGVLQFEDNEAPVATPSAVQVRRTIYSDAVDSWRRYEAELEPVRQRLIGLGVEL